MPDWIFILWVTINAGSQTTSRVTEAQCKAAIAEINDMADPLVGLCFGPAGERLRTSNVRDRLARWKQQEQGKAPAETPKVSKGIGL